MNGVLVVKDAGGVGANRLDPPGTHESFNQSAPDHFP
jgi:hypothetical protein